MKRILIDVDDVLADFALHTLQTLEHIGGPKLDPASITQWDMLSCIPSEWRDPMLKEWHQQGWCRNIPLLPGVQETVSALEAIGEVVYVTAPMHHAPFWMWERDQWLREHFNAAGRQIVFTDAKFLVRGDMLVDDKASNVIQWQSQNPKKKSVLWERPCNQDAKVRYRAHSWDSILEWFSE